MTTKPNHFRNHQSGEVTGKSETCCLLGPIDVRVELHGHLPLGKFRLHSAGVRPNHKGDSHGSQQKRPVYKGQIRKEDACHVG